MNEDCATAARDTWPRIVVDLDDQVVEVIVAPKSVAWFIGRAAERAVVTSIFGIFTPSSMWIDPPYWKTCAWPQVAIRPPPHTDQAKSPARGGAVTLALVRPYARAAEHDWNRKRPGEHDSGGPSPGPRADANDPQERPRSHAAIKRGAQSGRLGSACSTARHLRALRMRFAITCTVVSDRRRLSLISMLGAGAPIWR